MAGALIGVAMSVVLESWAGGSATQEVCDVQKYVEQFDAAMELLEQGLPL